VDRLPMPPEAAGSRLVALIMWHGGFEPRASAQQRIFWGFNRALSEADYHGVFLDLGEEIESEEENAAREAARLQYALDHRFAGIVFYPYAYQRNRGLIREAARRTPLVLIDRQIPGVETDYVGIDNLSAMQDATSHLMAQGHTRIALITRSEPINTVQDRIAGYRAAMRRADPPATDQVITVDSALEWSMFDLIFRLPPADRPTALLCVNDFIALQTAERLRALGLRIPEDVSLVGFDDLVQTLPNGVALTSVAQPFEEIGASAARLLLARIADPGLIVRHTELPAILSVRASSLSAHCAKNFGADLVVVST
jgi:LacI family transcriptional regulator